ncbi:conserved hypothetical protein (plasmid) [Enterococcus faecalis T2]|nr:conserved hypothetical protein [Enterococcus faecalis T2]
MRQGLSELTYFFLDQLSKISYFILLLSLQKVIYPYPSYRYVSRIYCI